MTRKLLYVPPLVEELIYTESQPILEGSGYINPIDENDFGW